VAATVALLLLGEQPTIAHALGATLIISGVLLSNRALGPSTPPAE
jgi:drug/metabolite transporter (DMT)-like permease